MRIGHGYDVHAFAGGDHVTLGGVRIPHTRGVRAHSDGDVLLHALCDALLGALGLGDIGQHFPDSDPRWKGADSRVFLRHCAGLLREHRHRVVNVDLTVLAEAPRLGSHRAQMCANVADFASKNTFLPSMADGLGMGVGFLFALTVISFFRELVGKGTLTVPTGLATQHVFTFVNTKPLLIMVLPAGGFLAVGILMAFFNWIDARYMKKAAHASH